MRRRRSGRLHLNAEINVVSLIDVMMLLLVIFMITAPLMQGGIDVKLPVATARPLDDKSSLVITIDQSGPASAFAKVECALPPRFFVDYLTLLKTRDGWRIVAKAFKTETR